MILHINTNTHKSNRNQLIIAKDGGGIQCKKIDATTNNATPIPIPKSNNIIITNESSRYNHNSFSSSPSSPPPPPPSSPPPFDFCYPDNHHYHHQHFHKYQHKHYQKQTKQQHKSPSSLSLVKFFSFNSLFMITILVWTIMLLLHSNVALADDSKQNSNSHRGLLSQVNNWFSRLRGNRDHNNNNNNVSSNSNDNDDKKDDKKDGSTSVKPHAAHQFPGYPPGYTPALAPTGAFSPMGPFGPQMMGMPPMYGPPIGMATQQFAQHIPAGAGPVPGAGGGAVRPGMIPASMAMSYNPMASAMGNPFAFAGSHMMP